MFDSKERVVESTPREVPNEAKALGRLDQKLREYIREVPLYQSAEPLLATASTRELLEALAYTQKQDIKTRFPANFLRAGQDLDDLVAKKLVEVEHTAGTTDTRADLLLEYGWWMRQEGWAFGLNRRMTEVLKAQPQAHRVTISSPACNGEITYTGTPSAKRRTLGNTRFLSLSRFPFLLSEEDLDRMVDEAVDWDPVFLDTDPVYATVFALHCERRKVRFPKLAFVFTSYEFTSVLHKRILERVFKVPVYNLYGSTETGHLLMENEAGVMVPSEKAAYLDVINEDERGIGELVVSTLSNDYMPLLNYRIGDLVERRFSTLENGDEGVTYVLHGRAPDTLKVGHGKRVTTREVDQCFEGVEGVVHYRLHETSPGDFTLSYIPDHSRPLGSALKTAVQKLEQLLQPTVGLKTVETQYLLPEGSGKFVFNYPYLSDL